MTVAHNWHEQHRQESGFGGRLADGVATFMGSWRFIILQSLIVAAWMGLNTLGLVQHWDVYPFVLLNLVFSTQAAYAAPIIMMSQNRAAERDRIQAQHDYETNERAAKGVDMLLTLHAEHATELAALRELLGKDKP